MLTPESLPTLQRAIRDAGLDGWLLFDFHGCNPIARGLLRLEGMTSRRVFAWIPREGAPVAVTHAIEQGPWVHWPAEWKREVYSSWRTLESAVGTLVRGRRIAMEYSSGDAVPYVDRVPAGVLDMVRALGAEVLTSAELVTRFYAVWTAAELESHVRTAEVVARIGRDAIAHAGSWARGGAPLAEHELQRWIMERFERAGLEEPDHGPIVAVDANAANPHYSPSDMAPVLIDLDSVLLIDLWAREPGGGIFADQTWMGVIGEPTARATSVWEAIRDARDAAIALIAERLRAGQPVRGAEADDAARAVIAGRGFGEYFTHRTGHSIDARSLHGAGPHLDNLESREERVLLPGVGFSIEPGIYIPGEIGMRSEVNGYIGADGLLVTPVEYQRDLLLV